MDWAQFAIFVIVNFVFTLTLCLQNRAETGNNRREISALIKAIQDEIKDFHGRLCAIEERKIKILEK